MVCVWVYMQKVELRHLLEYGEEKTAINQLNEKRSLIPWGLRENPRIREHLHDVERNDEDASKPSWRKSFALRALLLLLRMRSKTKR